MSVKVQYRGDTIDVKVNHSRIDGKNLIFQALVDDPSIPKEVEFLVFNLANVDYVNSLGIAEFISIHRYFNSVNERGTRIRFTDVDTKIATLFKMVELGNISEIELKTG